MLRGTVLVNNTLALVVVLDVIELTPKLRAPIDAFDVTVLLALVGVAVATLLFDNMYALIDVFVETELVHKTRDLGRRPVSAF